MTRNIHLTLLYVQEEWSVQLEHQDVQPVQLVNDDVKLVQLTNQDVQLDQLSLVQRDVLTVQVVDQDA